MVSECVAAALLLHEKLAHFAQFLMPPTAYQQPVFMVSTQRGFRMSCRHRCRKCRPCRGRTCMGTPQHIPLRASRGLSSSSRQRSWCLHTSCLRTSCCTDTRRSACCVRDEMTSATAGSPAALPATRPGRWRPANVPAADAVSPADAQRHLRASWVRCMHCGRVAATHCRAIGAIIGKKGATIQELIKRCGAHISVLKARWWRAVSALMPCRTSCTRRGARSAALLCWGRSRRTCWHWPRSPPSSATFGCRTNGLGSWLQVENKQRAAHAATKVRRCRASRP